jgi:hypothetical protein
MPAGYAMAKNVDGKMVGIEPQRKVWIPATVQEIANDAFAEGEIEEILIESGSRIPALLEGPFQKARHLKSIELPETLGEIGKNAFRGSPVGKISFADGSTLTVIASGAFSRTPNLKELEIPEGVAEFGQGSFA